MEFTFEENGELDTLDNVPTEFQGFYAKGQDGKFRIGEAHAPVTKVIDGLTKNLKNSRGTLTQTQQESKQRRESLEKWAQTLGYDTPEAAKAALDDLNTKVANNSKVKPEEIRAAIETEFKGKMTEKDNEVAAMRTSLEKHLRDGDATRAIAEHKGNDKLLRPHINSQTKVVKDEETGEYMTVVVKPDGSVRAGPSGSPMTVAELVAEMKKDKDFASAFEGTKQSGGGTPPQTHTQNRTPQTQQGELRGVSKISAGLKSRA